MLNNTVLKASLEIFKNKNKAFSVLLLIVMLRQFICILYELCEVSWILVTHFKDVSTLFYV